jgi:glutathione synthase/RimK-type ligase-like ATP-grasp enzyme
MKKIGILFGQENTYPQAFVDRVNAKRPKGITAEFVRIDKVRQARTDEYAVIIDRISQDVPFYRAYLKYAALGGTAVINNPFWWTADDKFFNNALAETIGVAVPRSVLLPSNQHPPNTDSNSMRNLAYPLDWEAIFDYVGFPAYLKPFSGGGWKNVYRVADADEFYRVYNGTGDLVMMLQEEVVFSDYFRCYCIDRRDVHIMPYDPRNPSHLRYVTTPSPESAALMEQMEAAVLKLNRALGYDFNTVELAVRDGVPYAIDFCNPAPDADYHSVQPDNFEWVVEATANMAIRRAEAHREGANNLTWGEFVASFVKDAFPV